MQCSNCGNNIIDRSNYCPRCATRISWEDESASVPGDSKTIVTPKISVGSVLLSYSDYICPWLCEKPNVTLEWSFHETTFLIGEDAVALVPMSTGSKISNSISLASRLTGMGVGGALIVGLPIAVLSAAIGQLTASRGNESTQVAKLLFDSGSMLLLPREGCTGHLFHYKEKSIFARQQSSLRLVGNILHTTGILPGFFTIKLESEEELSTLRAAGYRINEDQTVYEQMQFFKMSLPGDPGGAWMSADLVVRRMQGKSILS